MVTWDFHDENPEWVNKFDFIYTNSLDQAMNPRKALDAWSMQITSTGLIYIEHTEEHAPQSAGAMDPFGAQAICMPYLFFQWGKGRYELVDIIEDHKSSHGKIPVWIFVLKAIKRRQKSDE